MTDSTIAVLPRGSHLVMDDGRRGADVLLVRDAVDGVELMLPDGRWIRLDQPTPCSLVLGPS